MSPTPPVFAFGFTSPVMLIGLLAVGVPILIHLWSRRRYRQMYWAAVEYLLAAIRRSRRRLQLEQLLLLLLRTLVIALLVLAVAEPYLRESGFAFTSGERTHRVLVLDGSYSMAYRPAARGESDSRDWGLGARESADASSQPRGPSPQPRPREKTRFDQAKELAARIVEASPQGDGFTLVLMSDPPQVVVGNPVFEPRDLVPEIEGLALPHGTADLSATLAKVEQVLTDARREHPRLRREEVYFLTDLGRVGWLPDPADAATKTEIQARARRLAESASLVVIDLGQDGAENLAVTSLTTSERFATVASDIALQATVKNFGRTARSRQMVELLADTRRVRHEYVDLPPGGEVSLPFSYRFESPGDHTFEVRLAGDPLDVDNHRWLSVPVSQFIRVLCVDGRPSGKPFGGATDYLRVALAPEDDPLVRAAVRPDVVAESELLETDLARYDCVFLCDVAQFTSSEAQALDTYLGRGGGLVLFLGDRVMADRYNEELAGGEVSGVRLLPATLGPLVDQPEYRLLDPLGYHHPIVASFRDHERAGLLTTPVQKHFKLLVAKHSKAKVALRLANGDPLIVEAPVRRGRVVLFAISADASWTWMPKLPSYPPVVRDALTFAIGRRAEDRNVEVGQPLVGPVRSEDAGAPLFIGRPDGRREEVTSSAGGDSSTWSYSETSTSGVYTAQFGPPLSQSKAFAVNVDPVESDLTRLALEELRNEVWPKVDFVHQTTWEDLDEEPLGRIRRSSALAKALLYAVLTLLFVETFLAWRFGHHGQG